MPTPRESNPLSLSISHEALSREAESMGTCVKIRFYPLVVAETDGMYVRDPDGNRYLDFMAAGGVTQTGYRHPKVREALIAELDRSWSTMHCCYPSTRTIELAERLCHLVPGGFAKKAWFGTTGSDANDCLVKMLPAATGRSRLISFTGSYHGQTMGSAALSGHTAQAALTAASNITKVPYPNPYRPIDPDSTITCTAQVLDHLATVLHSVSPAIDTAAIVLEPIQSDGGDIVPPDDFLPALRSLCDEHGIWLVVDEVKTGMGRTGTMFAFEHAGIVPDAISLGKPLGGGLPLSAVVGRAELLDQPIMNMYTLGGVPTAAAAGLAVLDVIESEGLLDNATLMGERILAGLHDLQERHPLIGDVRGEGLICGVELVTDRDAKTPASLDAARVVYRCFELGLLLIYTGLDSNVLEMTPALTVQPDHVHEMLSILDQALTHVEAGRFDDSKLAHYAGW